MKFLLFLLLIPLTTISQPLSNWRFGSATGVTFQSGTAVSANHPSSQFFTDHGCATVSDNAGQLLFTTNGYWVYDRYDQRMPSFSGGLPYSPVMGWTGTTSVQSTLIVPFLNDAAKYYVFSLSTMGQLFYSVVDMNLNNGLGDIVPGQKGILLDYGLTGKLTAVQGCNNIWVVVREKNANSYKSYEVKANGISVSPVISACGLLPLDQYVDGAIRFSPDGRRMAAGCVAAAPLGSPQPFLGGLELYDFDPFTGKLSNPIVLDQSKPFYGVCFSGNSDVLYASAMTEKKVWQYDLSSGVPAMMITSAYPVLTNPDYYVFDWSCACWAINTPVLGELQLGPDGKIYIGNNVSDQYMQTANGYTDTAQFLHCIHNPDLLGAACSAQTDAIYTARYTGLGLPNDLITWPVQDTIARQQIMAACFRVSMIIVADTGKEYKWSDGSDGRSLLVNAPGIYTVSYTAPDCTFRIDSFQVHFPKLPIVPRESFACPGDFNGIIAIRNAAADSSTYSYSLSNNLGTSIYSVTSTYGDTIRNLDTGTYELTVSSIYGCDTSLQITIHPLPVPTASFQADSIICEGTQLLFVANNPAPVCFWNFGDGTLSTNPNTAHSFEATGLFNISLVLKNLEGCRDTFSRQVEVRTFDLELTATPDPVRKGDWVTVYAGAGEPFQALAWEPSNLFPGQLAQQQSFIVSEALDIEVIGRSLVGCLDTAVLSLNM
ncbi:MAG: hypothetical protein EOP49_19735, partial [Sphingobacteriales bacterium]